VLNTRRFSYDSARFGGKQMHFLMRKLLILIGVIATFLAAGCSRDPVVDRLPFVYRIDIQQGNVITQDMVNQLRPGMSRRQVEFILGAPLLVDPFHADRWDYVYLYNPGSDGQGDATSQHVTLIFDDDRVQSIDGTMHPDPHPDALPPNRQVTVVVPPQEREQVGILTRLWYWLGFGSEDG
jgi:outer membrane protein assembly factor BamE